jgi:hypothetical protein
MIRLLSADCEGDSRIVRRICVPVLPNLSTVCARELSARRFRFHLLRHLARRGTRTSGRCVGGIFRRRSFCVLFARYARHDIWRCTCRQRAERVQRIEFGSGFANRAALDVVPRGCGISSWEFRPQRLDAFASSRHRHDEFGLNRCRCSIRCSQAISACGVHSHNHV